MNELTISEGDFHRLADGALAAILAVLEQADEDGTLEVEYGSGVMTIILPSGKQLIINKHAPTRQLWLSSPISGGLHFPFNAENKDWQLPDGRMLTRVLSDELKALAQLEVTF